MNRVKLFAGMLLILLLGLLLVPEKNIEAAISKFKYKDYAIGKYVTYNGMIPMYVIDGYVVDMTREPALLSERGIAYASVNALFREAIGANVKYTKSKKLITIKYKGHVLKMYVGSTTAYFDGEEIEAPCAPVRIKYKKSKQMANLVPTRFVCETLGLRYSWYSSDGVVDISIPFYYDVDDEKVEYTGTKGKISFNGENIKNYDCPSLILSDTALLSTDTDVFDVCGIDFDYDADTGLIKLSYGSNNLLYCVGSRIVYVNGLLERCSVAPSVFYLYDVEEDVLYIPGRFTMENLGFYYEWNDSTGTSEISTYEYLESLKEAENNGEDGDVNLGDGTGINTGENTSVNTGEGTEVNTGEGTDVNTGESTDVNSGESTGVSTSENSDVNTGEGTNVNSGENTDINTGESTGVNVNTDINSNDNSDQNVDNNGTVENENTENSGTENENAQENGSGEGIENIDGQTGDDSASDVNIENNPNEDTDNNSDVNQNGDTDKNLDKNQNDISNIVINGKYLINVFNPNEGYKFFIDRDNCIQTLKLPVPQGISAEDFEMREELLGCLTELVLKGDYSEFYTDALVDNTGEAILQIQVFYDPETDETVFKIFSDVVLGCGISNADENYVNVRMDFVKNIYKKVIVMDAGHGDHDPGAQHQGYNESDLNLKVVLNCRDLFKDTDIKVYYTRIDDSFLSLYDRAAFAELVGADMFIAVHHNSSYYNEANGTSVYWGDKDISTSLNGLTSETLAWRMLENLVDALGTKVFSEGAINKNFVVVRDSKAPAVLLEIGFMSNPDELKRLVDDEFSKKVASTIVNTVLDIYEEAE